MLRDVLDRVRRNRRTLTLFTHDDSDEVTARVKRHVAVRNVEVTVRQVDPPEPAGFAVLHDDGEYIEAGSLSTFVDYVSPDEWEHVFDSDPQVNGPDEPPLLRAIDDGVYTVDAAGKRPLLRASHQIEHLATRSEPGTLFAGFQQLTNLRDNYGTWDRYRRTCELGTEIHIFGVPDQQFPDIDPTTDNGSQATRPKIHRSDADEIAKSWFLVYLGSEWSGVLIAEQVESPDDDPRYDGFFSFRRELAEMTADYLTETYLSESVDDDTAGAT